ncbi:MAG: encapsulin-associated ferritin-like protein [Alphaproteobacteria bacterium]
MTDSSEQLHEERGKLRPETLDRHRAIVSLREELEAVDWYDQRVDVAGDTELRGILAHNRDEEKEHASMLLEWLRRHDPVLNEMLKTYLFAEGAILEIEEADTGDGRGEAGDGSLGIGSLRGA